MSAVKGHEFFAEMINHFGDKVEVVLAMWSDTSDELRVNLDIFNQETRGKPDSVASQETAAFQTFTGRWARATGFSEIRSIDARPKGWPGAYEQVVVEFVRPGASAGKEQAT